MNTVLSPAELQQRFANSIRLGGGVVRNLHAAGRSFLVVVQTEEDTIFRRVYIRNITHGGNTRDEDEYRIQIVGVHELVQEGTDQTLLLGWSESEQVFAGFDVGKHLNPLGASPSFQVNLSTIQAAGRHMLATQLKGNDEVVVCLSPALLLPYIRDTRMFHELVEEETADAARSLADAPPVVTQDEFELLEAQYVGPRREIVIQVARKVRANSFRQRILEAYGSSCAVCGVQLGLVEAAHIVPVYDPSSTDETKNGIALCAQHHAAFDQGLISIGEDLSIVVEGQRVQSLQELGLLEGFTDFAEALRAVIAVPSDANHRPDRQYLLRRKQIIP